MSDLDAKIAILVTHGWYQRIGSWNRCRVCHEHIAPFHTAVISPKGVAYHERCAVKTKQAEKIFRSLLKIFRSLLLTDKEIEDL